MRRLILLLSLAALVVGIVIVAHTHGAYQACASQVPSGTALGTTQACQQAFWRELSGLLVLLVGGFVFLFAYVLGRRPSMAKYSRPASMASQLTTINARSALRGPPRR